MNVLLGLEASIKTHPASFYITHRDKKVRSQWVEKNSLYGTLDTFEGCL